MFCFQRRGFKQPTYTFEKRVFFGSFFGQELLKSICFAKTNERWLTEVLYRLGYGS